MFIYCLSEIPVFNGNSGGPDQMTHSVVSGLGLHFIPIVQLYTYLFASMIGFSLSKITTNN